jgi:4-hydroxy-tetrahydrodipicolinate synthase
MSTPSPDPRFRGAFTAIVTPFTADGSAIDTARLKAQIDFQAKGEDGKGGVRGIIIAGTTGESPTLSDAEYHQLVETAVPLARALGLLTVVGTGSNSTAHACELQRAAARAGADAALSVNPYYNKPTQEGLYRHFATQAESADIPVMLYNIPGRTGVALTPETVERLAALPRIVAIKEATGSVESCGEIAARCPRLAVLSGDDALTIAFASVGAGGVVSVISNLVPGRVAALCAALGAGDFKLGLTLHRALMPLARAMFIETNPIPVKAAMALLKRDTGTLRLPMTAARPETVAQVARALTAVGLA